MENDLPSVIHKSLPEQLREVPVKIDPIPQALIDAFATVSAKNKDKFPERGKLNFYLSDDDLKRIKSAAHIGQAINSLRQIEEITEPILQMERVVQGAAHLYEGWVIIQGADSLTSQDRELQRTLETTIDLARSDAQRNSDFAAKAKSLRDGLSTNIEWKIKSAFDSGSSSDKLVGLLLLQYYQAINNPRWYSFPPDEREVGRAGLFTDPQVQKCIEILNDPEIISNQNSLSEAVASALE